MPYRDLIDCRPFIGNEWKQLRFRVAHKKIPKGTICKTRGCHNLAQVIAYKPERDPKDTESYFPFCEHCRNHNYNEKRFIRRFSINDVVSLHNSWRKDYIKRGIGPKTVAAEWKVSLKTINVIVKD